MKSVFITIEGCDGCGKSTFTRKLSQLLSSYGYKVVETCEPGGTSFGKDVLALCKNYPDILTPQVETMLMSTARRWHCESIISPAISSSTEDTPTIVLCDRYLISNLVYQGILGGQDVGEIIEENDRQNIRMPDLNIFLDVSPKVCKERMQRDDRGDDRWDSLSMDKQQIIYDGFKQINRIMYSCHLLPTLTIDSEHLPLETCVEMAGKMIEEMVGV